MREMEEKIALVFFSLAILPVAMSINHASNWFQEIYNREGKDGSLALSLYLFSLFLMAYFLMKCQSVLKINIYRLFNSPDWTLEDVLDDAAWNLLFDPNRDFSANSNHKCNFC